MSGAAVRSEQVKTLYRHGVVVLLAHVILGALVCGALWSTGPRRLIAIWMGLLAALTLARVELGRRYWRRRPAAREATAWGTAFVIGSMLAGSLWGLGCFVLFDGGNAMAQLLVTFAVGGMCAGAAGTLACYLPAFRSFVYPSLGLLVVRTMAIGGPDHLVMGGMLIVFGLAMAVAARTAHQSITEAFSLRFENEALLARLSEAQARLQETNHSLEQRVTERTAALERQGETLREAQRLESVGRLAAGIAHDFNNLLTVVLANTTLLLRERHLDERSLNAVEEVKTAASRGADLVRQLLAFGRQQRLAPQVIDLNAVVARLGPLLARLIGEQVQMTVVLSPGKARVKTDRSQIEQVIVNLVTNARDAMPEGGQLSIETTTVQADKPGSDFVVLTVIDTGLGMDGRTRHRVFEPFFTTKPFGKGTGLGLATVHGVVEQSGGRVEVESQPGAGSRFRVWLPLSNEPETVEDGPPLAAMGNVRGTILLAEDDDDTRSAIDHVLRAAGHEVIAAAGGEEALERSRLYPGTIHILVSDVVMPDMGGAELSRLLFVERPDLRVLFISGYIPDEDSQPNDSEHVFEYLAKPVTSERLQRKVATLLGPVMEEAAHRH
jgi:signal transduction histidine kinase/ActR/RegA family two-component response regulator